MSSFKGRDLVPHIVYGGTDSPVIIELPDSFQLDKLPFVEFLKKDQLPETAGIYFAVDNDYKVWYIGKAQNLRARWLGHHRYDQLKKINKKNNIKLLWYCCDKHEINLTQLENYFIDKYHPALNQTKLEAKRITPSEVELRNTLVKIGKYVVIFGYEENSKEFGLPTVHLKYECLHRNPARFLRNIFDAVNKKGNLRWSYYWRSKSHPVWNTKCNGKAIVVSSATGVNELIQSGEEITLAGISLLNISTKDFQEYVLKKDWTQTYHPAIRRYTNDPIPLIWSKDLEINQYGAETLRELNKQRTERKVGTYRPRGRRVKVVCNVIGWSIEYVVEAYKEAIDWFGGNEALGLREAYSPPSQPSFGGGWKPHKVTVRLPEVENGNTKYKSLSAPISASTREELMQRFENIRQLSPLHKRVKLER